MTLAHDIMVAMHRGDLTPSQAFAMQAARESTVATIDPREARARATALVIRKVIESPLGSSLVAACAKLGIHLELQECYAGYSQAVEGVRNLVTWGMKRSHDWYLAGGRNCLFVENGLLRQRHGTYVDAGGYFADSSVVSDRQRPTPAEIALLGEHVRRDLGWGLWAGGDPGGPILVALQTPDDAPLRFYCSRSAGSGIQYLIDCCAQYLPGGVPVILRPHPRHEAFQEQDYRIPDGWVIDRAQDGYARLRQCRAVVTVNSTLGIEALSLGIPVAFMGRHVYSGSDAGLECDGRPQRLRELATWVPDRDRVEALLCAVLRRQIAYSASPADVLASVQFQAWADRCLRGTQVPVSRLAAEPEGADYEAASMRLRAGADPILWDLVHATDGALETCVGDCRRRHMRRVIDADMATAGRPPVFGPRAIEALRSAGLDVWRPDLRRYRDRMDAAHAAPGPRLEVPAADVTLGFLYGSHLGDALCTTALAAPLAASGRQVGVVRHRITYAAWAGHAVTHRNQGRIRLSAPAEVGPGQHCQRLLRWFGLPEPYYPRPDIRLTDAERSWAAASCASLPRPRVIVCAEAVSNADGYAAMPWHAWVTALAGAASIIQVRQAGVELTGCLVLSDLDVRQFLAVFSQADAYLGTWAAGIHAAAAFGLETICVCKSPVTVRSLTFPVPLAHITSFLYPQHAYGWVHDCSTKTPEVPP